VRGGQPQAEVRLQQLTGKGGKRWTQSRPTPYLIIAVYIYCSPTVCQRRNENGRDILDASEKQTRKSKHKENNKYQTSRQTASALRRSLLPLLLLPPPSLPRPLLLSMLLLFLSIMLLLLFLSIMLLLLSLLTLLLPPPIVG
jgi:hypothetical protein